MPREQADSMFYFACLAGVRIGAWAKHIRMWSPDETRNALLATGTVQPTLTEKSIG